MIANFNLIANKNGNTTVSFVEDGKHRYIIFHKGSEAQLHFAMVLSYFNNNAKAEETVDETMCYAIKYMRKQYRFTKNPNNPQYFYAERKLTKAQQSA